MNKQSFYLALGMLLVSACAHPDPTAQPIALSRAGVQADRVAMPPTECEARTGYDRDMMIPGYLLPTSLGPETCIPFSTVRERPPAGYVGDYYVDEFTDAKLRERWEACKIDEKCHARVYKQIMKRHPPNKEYGITSPRDRFLLGKVDEKGEVDLTTIRRPAFFARQPYSEPIAALDGSTYTIEFTAPAEPYERIHRQTNEDVKLRGWYIRGAGIEAPNGDKVRALITMGGGGGTRAVAIDHPSDTLYSLDPVTGTTHLNDFPNDRTGEVGAGLWRETAHRFNQAGFDVLLFDRRGVGVSGGFSDTNTLQQGRDLLQIVSSLRTGEGLRALPPSGVVVSGLEAATAIRGDNPYQGLPVLFMGSSRGTMSSGWAMTMNFDKDCSYDLPAISCGPPRRDLTIKGAILLAEYSSGVGYVPRETTAEDDGRGPGRDRVLFIGGMAIEHNIVFFPSSAILAGIHKWPGAFFARGLFDYAAALEGSIDSYSRVTGPKELVVVRGPHPYETWPEIEQRRVQERMIAFAKAAALGQPSVPDGRPWSSVKELIATTNDVWEPSSHPSFARSLPQ